MLNTIGKYQCFYALACCIFFCFAHSNAQNLVPNPDFEMYDNCPNSIGSGYLHCLPWEDGNNGTSDYFNACDNTGFVDVPTNVFGDQAAHSGDGYAGFYVRSQTTDYFEYIQAPLIDPLEGGVTYHVSFYVSLADEFCGAKHIGAYFSFQPPPFAGSDRLDVVPQIDYAIDTFLSDKEGWVLISGCFTAEGDEAYITIGNFHLATETELDPDCSPASIYSYYYIDDIVVEEGADPGVIPFDLGGPVTDCNEYVIQTNVDNVGYLWEDGSIADSLLVLVSGNFAATISDGCNVGIDSIDIMIEGSADPVDIGTDSMTICNGEQFDIFLDPAWDYIWSDGTLTPDISLSAPGTYIVTRDDGCNITSDIIVLNMLNPPAPFSLGLDTVLCAATAISIRLDSTLGNFIWQDGDTSATYTITSEGLFAVTISNQCGSQSDDVMVTTITPPAIELGPPMEICSGSILLINLDTLSTSFLWQDGSVNSSYQVSGGGLYAVTVTNLCGSESDTLVIDEILRPSVDLGPDIHLCFAQLPYSLDITGSPGAIDYVWQDGSVSPLLSVTNSGVYSVTVSNSCFAATDSILIQITNDPPQVNLPSDITICQGDSILLANAGAPGLFLWNDLSTDSTYLVTMGGTYALTVTNICGAGADTVIIGLDDPPPIPDLGPDFFLCEGQTVLLSPMIPDVIYSWQDMSTADSLLVSSPGVYYVQVSNHCGSSADTITCAQVDNVPPIDFGKDTMFCSGDTLTLDAGPSDANFLWQDGAILSTYHVTESGTYFVSAFNQCNTESDTISILLIVPPMSFDLGSDTTICQGDSILMSAPSGDFDITWQDGSHMPSFVADAAQTYFLVIENECGMQKDSISVDFAQQQTILDLEPQIPICAGESVMLDATQSFDVTYAWSTGEVTPGISITETGVYTVSITSLCATETASVEIYQNPACSKPALYVPNVFSPNGDNINDVFSIVAKEGTEIQSGEVSIFDRWGNLVYYSTDIPFMWDGSIHHMVAPPAVYVYLIHLQINAGDETDEYIFKGDITLLR